MVSTIFTPPAIAAGGTPTQIGQAVGTNDSFGLLTREADAWDGVTSAGDGDSASSTNNTIMGLGKDYSGVGGKAVIGFKAWGSTDLGFIQGSDPTGMVFELRGHTSSPTGAGQGTLIGSKTGIDDANGLAVDASNDFTESAVFDFIWVEFPAAGGGQRTVVAEVEIWELV